LSEFHSGYRAYSTAALGRIPFPFNSNGLHFDTEITIQLLLSSARITEVPIPPYHGDEISFGTGLKYSWNVLATCLKARAQELSLFFDRKFDCVPSTSSNVHYKPRLGFESTHTIALDCIPAGSRVLDIGCAGGYFSRLLGERGCHATGIDRFPLESGNTLEAFHLHDLNRMPLPVDVAAFDYAVMLDVLEHLQSPETFVDEFRTAAARNPNLTLLISTPNVAFIVVRLMLLAGQFNYGKRGILDLTHTRLFTFGTFRRLFEQSGYEVLQLRGVPAPFPLALGDTWTARLLLRTQRLLIGISRSLFAFQIFAIVRPKAGLPYLLDRAVVRRAR
jgi:SAM-dependent methyltransferase